MFWTFRVDITLAGCFARALFSFYKNKNDLHVFSRSITESSCFTSFLQHQSSFLFSTFYFQCRLVGLHSSFFLFCFFKDWNLYCGFIFHITTSYKDIQTQRLLLHDVFFVFYTHLIWVWFETSTSSEIETESFRNIRWDIWSCCSRFSNVLIRFQMYITVDGVLCFILI